MPENSGAQGFYESLGFETLGEKRARYGTRTSKPCLIQNYCESSDMIIPMMITRKNALSISKILSENMCRIDFVRKSRDINNLVSLT